MVANYQIEKNPAPLFFNTLPKSAVLALKKCSEMDFFLHEKWYLAGGTALALQAGHRKSYDLDFFTERKFFDEKKAEQALHNQGEWKTSGMDKGTIFGTFLETKMSLIAYPFFTSTEKLRKFGTISLLAPADIAVMKIVAIAQRGKKRDFFDLYWICKNITSLYESILKVNRQYSVPQNPNHILKSLVYFEDAESDPEPEIYFRATWKEVKKFFIKEVPIIAKKVIK